MARKPQSKPTLTDAERHARFVEMGREVEASESPKDFEAAFGAVTKASRLVGKPLPAHRAKRR
jgi:hypothetical protein